MKMKVGSVAGLVSVSSLHVNRSGRMSLSILLPGQSSYWFCWYLLSLLVHLEIDF